MKLFPKPRQCVCGDDMLKLDKLTVCAGAYQGAADFLGRAVERLCGVKDYGNLIPGHGGMLDRFDSMFWTAAIIEILVNWVSAIS